MMRRAEDEESVLVQFDVTAEGATENITIVETTNRCLNDSSVVSVRQWEYSPKVLEGEPVARKNVQTLITYVLMDSSDARFRLTVRNRLFRAQNFAVKKKKPTAAFEVLENLEEKYGESFSDVELSAFYQVRALARLEASDYAGALDDFRLVKRMGTSSEDGSKLIDDTIQKLEAALGVESTTPVLED